MIELKIPKLGLTMEKAKLLSWQFRPGDEVKKGETIFIIETDKVTFEVSSPTDGIIHPVGQAGETYLVDQTVGYLADNRESMKALLEIILLRPWHWKRWWEWRKRLKQRK